jgi:hypothetical protein
VERSPADRIPSHGTDLLGPWYAYDLVRTDHRPVRESWVALGTTVGFAQGGLDPARLAGNHVIVAPEGRTRCMRTWHRGASSSAGAAGPRRRDAGMGRAQWQLDRPHLHFHLMDSADPAADKGEEQQRCRCGAAVAQRGEEQPGLDPVPAMPSRSRRHPSLRAAASDCLVAASATASSTAAAANRIAR